MSILDIPPAKLTLNERGAWTASTAYAANDIVTTGGVRYICKTAHSSSSTFSADVSSKWIQSGVDSTTSSLSVVKNGNAQSYSNGSAYSAYTGMWGVYVPTNTGLVFTASQHINPMLFPAMSSFAWNVTPDSRYTGINGYLHVDYGNYDNSPGSITPRQVYQLTVCSLDARWAYSGNPSSGLLSELWLTSSSAASGALTKVFEVGFLPKLSASSLSYAQSLAAVGTGSFTNGGVTWNVGIDSGATPTYLVAYRADLTDHQGVLPYLAYLTFLISAGAITGNEWVNGIAFGVEPLNGAGTLVITGLSGNVSGAPRVPYTISNLSATVGSSTTVTLGWSPAPGATSHQYQINGGAWTTTSGSSSQTITGLTASTAYTFNVRGVNASGNAASSNTASATTTAANGATNIVTNGDFSSGTTGWSGFGSGGKTVTAGKAVFSGTSAYDGISQAITPTVGKYYEVQYTVSNYTAGDCQVRFVGGTDRQGAFHNANGTYTERLLANTGNNTFAFYPGSTSSYSIDDISCFGPYNTSTVGGS